MTRRFSSISTQTTLATSISNTALSLVVATGTASTLLGGVSLTAGNVDQFKIILDPDTASSEICYVTEVTSDTLTIQRGKDGTSAVSHTGGAVIKHVLTGEDLTYFTTGVVPTSDLATGLPFPGSTSGTATLKAPAVAGTTTVTLPGATGTLATLDGAETLTNKTVTGLVLSDASVIFEGATADAFETTLTVTDPTADRTITLPNASGTVALTSDIGSVTFHGCSANCNASVTLVANVPTVIPYATEGYDSDAYHDTVTNNSRITIPAGLGGKYKITCNLGNITATSNYMYLLIYANGVAVTGSKGVVLDSGYFARFIAATDSAQGTIDLNLVAGDYIEIFMQSNLSGANTIISNFQVSYLGA